ncbi:MAG: phosphoglycerate mutase (2,3-diphosphoglycerate-independent), partial [Elusimicrobiales bacterium]|nr:phosphoglycerate mutase (2,3-diphosphoglycerate-independent) [Elusimicrobiales bacterium]
KGLLTTDPIQALEQQYAKKVFDEFIDPIVITSERKKPLGLIEDGDTVINFNFRADRARQITRAFVLADFDKFETESRPNNIYYVGLSEYEESVPIKVAFPPQKITTRVGGILSENKKKQLRIAETEKFAHVTYFFNGGMAEPFAGEDRIFVPSKNVKSYAEIPEMSAYEVTEKLLKAISTDKYDFVLVNYANTDMVGHTGVFKAGIKTLEVIDACLERLISSVLAVGGCLIITADHGNIEEMMNLETGEVDTKHSTNPVPLWFVAPDNKKKQPQLVPVSRIQGMLVDVPAMVLELFNIKIPTGMIGESLLARWD